MMSANGYTRLENQEEEVKPPSYLPEDTEPSSKTPPAYSPPAPASAIPPSYEQAEKLKKDSESRVQDPESQRTDNPPQVINAGGYCEFFVFFLICFVFGWIGYLFACCLMVTVAASTGSAAGFGLYLVQVAVLVNVYHLDGWSWDNRYSSASRLNASHSASMRYNNYYGDNDYLVAQNTSYFFGWLLWLLAFCGVLLFFKSLITFGRAKNLERRAQNQSN